MLREWGRRELCRPLRNAVWASAAPLITFPLSLTHYCLMKNISYRPLWAMGWLILGLPLASLAQPSVIVRTPARNTASAPRATNVALTFSQAMNAATDQNMAVFSAQRGGRKAGTYSTVGNTITFNPSTDFRPGEKIQVVVPPSVTSGGGVAAVKQVHEFWAATTGGSGAFASATLPTQGSPTSGVESMALGDVTGDGRPDMVSFDELNGFVVVRPGNGAGSFGAALNRAVDANNHEGALADVDGDGDLDVLLVHSSPDRVAVWRNNGAGGFSSGGSTLVPFTGYSNEPIVGDIDADGDLDFVVDDFNGDQLFIRLNDGAGGFVAAPNLPTGDDPSHLVLADIESDGDLDIVFNHNGADQTVLRRNNGAGVFGAATVIVSRPGVGGMSRNLVADVNGDGFVDLISIDDAPMTAAYLETRLNDGTGAFALNSAVYLFNGSAGNTLTMADFDGDGDLDVVTASTNDLITLLNRGNGTFDARPSEQDPTLFNANRLANADLDGDGDVDLVRADRQRPSSRVLLNQSFMTVTSVYPTRNQKAAPRATNVVLAFSDDLQAFGSDHMYVFGEQAGGRISSVYSLAGNTVTINPNTSFRAGEAVSVSIPASVRSLAPANRPVKPHVFQFTAAATGGTGTFATAPNVPLGDQPTEVQLGDFNEDGHLDMVAATFLSDQINVRFGDGAGGFTGSLNLPFANARDIVVAEMNDDFNLDILVIGSGGPTLWLGNGNGTFQAPKAVGNDPGLTGLNAVAADVDGDADLDLLISSSGSVRILYNYAFGEFPETTEVPTSTGSRGITCADVDNDGDLDLLVANTFDDAVSVHRNNGSGAFGAGTAVAVGDFPETVIANDIDGDGDVDFAVGNLNGTSVSIGRNNGTGTFTISATLATSVPHYLSLADIDGDADLDLMTNSAIGTGIWRNNGLGAFTAAASADSFGEATAVGDLDEDGDLDLVVVDSNTDLARVRLNQDAFQVSSVSPTRNDANALRSADVAVTFNKNVNNGTSNRIRIWGQQRGGKKAGAYSTAANTVTFNPTLSFAPGELVSVTVPGTVVSTGGEAARRHVYQYTAAVTGGTATFTNGADISAGGDASAVATADVTGDGLLDVIACGGSNQLRVYPGNGNGTFGGGGAVIGTVSECYSLIPADLDNDGDMDLLATSYNNDQVVVFLNGGAGAFGAGVTVSVGDGPGVISVGDLDADGDLDFVTANFLGAVVSVRLNNGSGGFVGAANVPTGNFTAGVALGDVDDDGDLDLVSSYNNFTNVRLNNGSGAFSGGSTVPTVSGNGTFLRDMDGDGALDLVVNSYTGISVSRNDGTGAFGNTLELPANDAQGFEATVGDFDGDGDFDIVHVNGGANGDNLATLWLNNGNATFVAGTPISSPAGYAVAQGDLDNDGDLDLLTTDFGNDVGVISVRLNENAFTVTARTPERQTNTTAVFSDLSITLSEAVKPTTASRFRVFGTQSSGRKGGVFSGVGTSLTLDANVDFAPGEVIQVSAPATIQSNVGSKALQPHVYQLRAAATGGTGTFSPAPSVTTFPGPADAQLADMDGDGDRDLVILDINADQISVRLNDGAANFTAGGVTATENAPQAMTLADVDADGDLDVLTMSTSPMTLGVRLNAGDGTFAGSTDIAVPEFAVAIAAGDVDGDGDLDFVTANKAVNTSSIRLNNGLGTFADGGTVSVGAMPVGVALSDVDNDGDLDLLTANQDGGTVSLRRNDGHGTFSGTEEITVGATPQMLTLADIDADGDADLLTANGPANSVTVRRNTGTGAFGAVGTLVFGSEINDLDLADIDGDGDLDLLIALRSTNVVRVGLNNGSGAFALAASVPVGDSPQSVASGDLDGDGDLDFVTADIATTTVSVRLNSALAGPAPLIASFVPDHGPTGTVVTISGTNFTGTTAVTFDGVAAPGFVVSGGGTEITVSSPPATFNGPITITTPDGSVSTATDFGVDLVITGVEAIPAGDFHHITVTATGIASLSGPVEATAPVLVQTGGALFTGPNVLSGAGDFTLEPAATLTVGHPLGLGNAGAIQLTGGLTLPVTADYGFNGGAAQVTGLNLPAEVRNLTISNPATVSLTQPTDIRQVLTVAGSGDFNLNGQPLRLLSDAAGTALLANTGAGKVVGTATAQVWLNPAPNAGLGYRHMAAPTTNATVADLATPGFVPVATPAYNTAENPLLVKPYPNVFGFDETRLPGQSDFITGYFSPLNLASALTVGAGYTAYMKGGLTPDFVGPLTQTDVTRPNLTRTGATTKTGWHLLGNPYPSPIDWDLVTVPASLNPAVSVFQSTVATNGLYLTRANGIGSLPNGIIPMGQAFFVQVDAAPVSFTFTNACRVTTFGSPAHYRSAADPRPAAHLTLRATGAPATETDGAVVYFQEGATTAADRDFDGEKPAHNPGLPTLVSLTSTGAELAELAVNGLPETALQGATVELLLDLPAAGTYELATAQVANLTGTEAALLDRLTGTRYDLQQQPTVTVTARAAGEVRGRFALVFGRESGRVTSGSGLALALYPNPAHGSVRVAGAAVGPVELLDATGRVVRRVTASATAETVLDLAALPAGVYVVRAGAASQRLVVNE